MICALLCLALATSAALAQSPPSEKEKVLGKMLAQELERQFRPLDDPEVTAYIDGLVDRLAPVTMVLVGGAQPLAASLPGQIVVLTSGAIVCAASEAELAALLAHAIAHTRLAPPEIHAATGTVPLIFMGGESGYCARNNATLPAAFQKRVARREQEADALALRWLTAAGYDTRALPQIFKRYASGYPPAGVSGAPQNAIVTTSEFDRIRARLAPPPAAPRPAPSLKNPKR